MSNTSVLGALEYELESAFGEDVATFATFRIPLLDRIDFSGLKHDKIEPNRVVQYRNDGTPWIAGEQSGEFKTKIYLAGHGSSTAGATTLDPIETLLGVVFGNAAVSSATGTTATGGTASALTTAAVSGFSAGGLCRVGTLGDGRGNGQFYLVSGHGGSSLNLSVVLDAAPVNGDVIYSSAVIHPSESPTAGPAASSVRMRALTANLQYELHGVFAKAVSIGGLNPGEVPFAEITWGVAWWRQVTGAAFPSAIATSQYTPAPTAAGSFYFNTLSTLTRVKRLYRDLTIDYTLGIVELKSAGGAGQYQTITGVRRTPDQIKLSWTEDAATTTEALWTGASRYNSLITLSPSAGSSVGFFFSNLAITGARPVQTDRNGINSQKIECMAYTGPTTTNELTLSAFRMAFS